jgi:tetratricopeptide (TPR) repeat protein
MFRALVVFCAASVLATGGAAVWWNFAASEPAESPAANLPVPLFPPRIAEGSVYEACLATLVTDRAGSLGIAEAPVADGDDGAAHCRGLALIAIGKPAQGAEALEDLSHQSTAPTVARAVVLGQAGQARLMIGEADRAVEDASAALVLSPASTEMFILRATAEGMLGRFQDAVDDLGEALDLEANRPDALVARAVMRRKLEQLDLARADVSQALALDPDDPEALLERGILRQRLGDDAGARADWEHARDADPDSTTAELAAQNLSLLEAGRRK